MSVNAILTSSPSTIQPTAASQGHNGQSYRDWLATLGAATGSTGGSSSPQLTDQMQALLTQLQAGNTFAPAAASAGGAPDTGSVSAASASTASSSHGHHHHHVSAMSGGGSASSGDGSGLGVLQDLAANLAGNTASTSGSGATTAFGSSNSLLGSLQSLGSTALTGIGTAIQAYAAIHGVSLAQSSTLV